MKIKFKQILLNSVLIQTTQINNHVVAYFFQRNHENFIQNALYLKFSMFGLTLAKQN